MRPVPHRETRNLNKKTLPQQTIRTNSKMQALHQVEAKKRQTKVDIDNIFSTVFNLVLDFFTQRSKPIRTKER